MGIGRRTTLSLGLWSYSPDVGEGEFSEVGRRRAAAEAFAHAGEKAEVSIKIVRNAEPVIERVRGQL